MGHTRTASVEHLSWVAGAVLHASESTLMNSAPASACALNPPDRTRCVEPL
jgi:hypothetical protein